MLRTHHTFLFIVVLVMFLGATGCTPDHEVVLEVNTSEGGEVQGDGVFEEGDQIVVEAVPHENYEFIKWIEDEEPISTDQEYEFEVEEDRQLTAVFENMEYEVVAEPERQMMGSVSGGGTYQHGDLVTVRAESEEDVEFEKWLKNGEKISSDATYEFEATGNEHLEAVFKRTIPDVLKKAMAGEEFDEEEIIKELWEFNLSISTPIDDQDAEEVDEKFDSSGEVFVKSSDFDLALQGDCYFDSPFLIESDVAPDEVGFGYDHIELMNKDYLMDKGYLYDGMGMESSYGFHIRYQFKDVADGSTIQLQISSILKDLLDFDTDELQIHVGE